MPVRLKSLKPINMKELILIKEFLLFYVNTALLCINSEFYIEVDELEIIII